MKTGRTILALFPLVLLAAAGGPAYGTWTWSQLDYPGAAATYAYGVDGGTIVGSYVDAAGGTHGFARDAGGWRTLDYPGAEYTHVSAVSGSKMVGYYRDASNDRHGFLYDGTAWETIDYAGAMDTYLYGISGDRIVGTYRLPPYSISHGFISDGNSWTTLPYAHYAYGISDNKIVGNGFVYDGATWTYVQCPPDFTYPSGTVFHTYFVGISGNNIVGNAIWGYYPYLEEYNHSFLYDGTTWQTLDYPGSTVNSTYVWGISGDSIVGSFADATGPHAFLLTIPEPASLALLGLCAALGIRRHRRS